MAKKAVAKQQKPVIPTEPSEPLEAVIDDEELTKLTLAAASGEFDLNPQGNSTDDADAMKRAFNAATPEAPIAPPAPTPPPAPPVSTLPDGWPVPNDFKLPRRAYTIGDLFADLSKFDTKAKQVLWLRHNDKMALRYILKLAFDPSITWLLPVGLPPYKAHKGRPGSAPSELLRECRRLYLFIKGGNDNVTRLKREKLFQQTIEGLEKEDVKALAAIKDHTLPETFGLTPDLVEQAFPGLLSSPTQIRFIAR